MAALNEPSSIFSTRSNESQRKHKRDKHFRNADK